MRWLTEFFKGTPVHIFGGALVGMFYTWFVIGSPHTEELSNFVNTIMTILASLLAAGAAIASASWESERRKAGELRAAKVTLPLALTDFVRVSESGIRYALEDEAFFKSAENRARYVSDISLSNETLETIKSCVASADETSAKWLSVLVQHYQVYNSRLLSNFDDLGVRYSDYQKAEHIEEWILLKALAEHLFDYSRGAQGTPNTFDTELLRLPFLTVLLHTDLGTKVSNRIASSKNYYEPYTPEDFELIQQSQLPAEGE